MAKKKKILFVDQKLGGGGAERILCTVMRSLDQSAFDVHLMLTGKKGTLSYLIPDNVVVHELGKKNTRYAFLSYIKSIKKIRPATVFSSLSRTTVLSILARPLCPYYKIIARYPNMPSLENKFRAIKGWRQLIMKLTYNKVDAIISQTEEMAAELHQFYRIDKQNIYTIHNPIDTDYIDECIKNRKNPFNQKYINIVASGRITYQKGFDTLINAFNIALGKERKLRLHILGQNIDQYVSKLKELAHKHKIHNKVVFYGFVENPYPFYKFCDLFVLSSRWEGFPNVLLEHLYLRKKVIATNCLPIIRRLIQNGDNGFIVDIDNEDQLAQAILKYEELEPRKLEVPNVNERIINLLS